MSNFLLVMFFLDYLAIILGNIVVTYIKIYSFSYIED